MKRFFYFKKAISNKRSLNAKNLQYSKHHVQCKEPRSLYVCYYIVDKLGAGGEEILSHKIRFSWILRFKDSNS